MDYLTDDKLVIIGAAGMIGSNMAQLAALMHLTPHLCLYDVYAPGLEGVVEELRHCGFDGMDISYTSEISEALTGADYIISSGSVPTPKKPFRREDLLYDNGRIAKQLGEEIRQYCPDLKHLVIIFNPVDATGLITMLYSGLDPRRVTTLNGLDSTRLQSELASHFGVPQYLVTGALTLGGHGEEMTPFTGKIRIDGTPLRDYLGTERLTREEWSSICERVVRGGFHVIDLRGRSAFQSPSYLSICMIRAAMGGEPYRWPVGSYVSSDRYDHVFMTWDTLLDREGVHQLELTDPTEEEMRALDQCYNHLTAQVDKVIELGLLPPRVEWHRLNPYIR